MKTRTALMLPLLLSGLGGCVSMRPTMTRFSLDYNRVVADTRNRMILLNIVRAAYREPTYYTALSQIEGSLNLQGSFNGSVANLAGGDETSFSPTVAGSITNAPTFTVVPLTSEEFSKGMLKPIDPETIRLLLSQGWRPELLAPLVVQKVQCIYDGRVFHEIDNRPAAYDGTTLFQSMSSIQFTDAPADVQNSYQFDVASESALDFVTGGALDSFDIQQKADGAGRNRLSVTPRASPTLEASIPDVFKQKCRDELQEPSTTAQAAPSATNSLSFTEKTVDPHAPAKKQDAADASYTNLIFRSPDEIVYYLGELLRERQKRGAPLAETEKGIILFNVVRNATGPAAIDVDHRGAHWSVPLSDPMSKEPGADRDRTLEVIALLNELIASQTSAADFSRAPSTIRVR